MVNQWGGQEGFSFGDFTNEIKDRARDLMEYPMGLDREEAEHLALFEVSSIAGNGFVNSPALADSFKGLARQVKELDICRSARIKAVGFYAGDIK